MRERGRGGGKKNKEKQEEKEREGGEGERERERERETNKQTDRQTGRRHKHLTIKPLRPYMPPKSQERQSMVWQSLNTDPVPELAPTSLNRAWGFGFRRLRGSGFEGFWGFRFRAYGCALGASRTHCFKFTQNGSLQVHLFEV